MSEYIVDVDNVTVRFNKASENIDNLKEYFVKLVKHELMFKEFLALQNVNLKIRPGEAWAIIGTNGSGKSTLLKVISRILKPYKGNVTVNGTVASLIELGAGIDPKLIEASQDLGAGSRDVFTKVIIPLSLPGVISGITMVFVPAISTFIISRMLGGGSNLLIGDLIEMQFLGNAYNPHLGAAISLVLMVIILVIMTVMNQFDPDDQVLM